MPLQAIDDGIWLAEGGLVSFYGVPYPTRSIIVRLPGSALWVWSPIALTPELKAEVESLGAVAHLVSPNKLHHLYLQDWKTAFPAARLWGPQSTIDKRSSVVSRLAPPRRDRVFSQGVGNGDPGRHLAEFQRELPAGPLELAAASSRAAYGHDGRDRLRTD